MRITESRLRQIIQEVMTEGNFEQAHAEELQSAMDSYKSKLESAVYGLLGAYLELHGDDEAAANAVLADVKNILGS